MGEVIDLLPRIPYPATRAAPLNIDECAWRLLIDTIFPSAQTADGVLLAISYCLARKLDIMKKPVSIVPMYSKALGRVVETVWPGINEIQTTAARTGQWAGLDAPKFGPDKTSTFVEKKDNGSEEAMTLTYPEWAEVTVYRLVGGVRCPFTERLFWLETYSKKSAWSEIPSAMWVRRPGAQLAKCAKASALRAAFPEEIGYAAEEMEGKVLEADGVGVTVGRSTRTGSSGPDETVDPSTGEITTTPPSVDLGAVSPATRELVRKLIKKAEPHGAWETAIGAAEERLAGNDLAFAKLALRHAERAGEIPEDVRSSARGMVERAARENCWSAAAAYLAKVKTSGKLSASEFEYAKLEFDLAHAEHMARVAAVA